MKKPTPPSGSPTTPRPAASRPGVTPESKAALERALALRDVMDHAVQVQREITAPKTMRDSRLTLVLLSLVLALTVAMAGYTWIARPAFIWGSAPRIPAARAEAGERVAMFLLAQRLDAHRQADGIYPRSLAQIGETATDIAYTLVADTIFELRSRTQPLVLRSTQPRDVFLGNSLDVISHDR